MKHLLITTIAAVVLVSCVDLRGLLFYPQPTWLVIWRGLFWQHHGKTYCCWIGVLIPDYFNIIYQRGLNWIRFVGSILSALLDFVFWIWQSKVYRRWDFAIFQKWISVFTCAEIRAETFGGAWCLSVKWRLIDWLSGLHSVSTTNRTEHCPCVIR